MPRTPRNPAPGVLAVLLALSATAARAAGPQAGPHPDPAAELHALFASEWERGLREDPVSATLYGDLRWNALWPDPSEAAVTASQAADHAALVRLHTIDRKALGAADQLDYDLFERELVTREAGIRFRGWLVPVTQMGGIQSLADVVELIPAATEAQLGDWVTRLEHVDALVDGTIALMKRGLAEHRTPPKIILRTVPDQIRANLVTDPSASRFYLPLASPPATIPEAALTALRERARAAITGRIVPAYQRFLTFFEKDYLPHCRDAVGASALPDGKAYYAYLAARSTTTNLTPEEIHQLGLSEVARIHGEMQKIIAEVGFKGSFADFLAFLRKDARFYYRDPAELMAAYQVIAKRIDPELPRLFGKLPRAPYGVRAIPDASAPAQTTAYYQPAALDGSRPGWFYVNLFQPETRPKYEMEALTAHESVPGHHLQIALANELGAVPEFRKVAGYTAFVEGWGLYAESLGAVIGLYHDPYSHFGQLTYEMWRAVRLVVDTGMHVKGWTRDQAIAYFKENAAKSEHDITVEIDRYLAWPGQALAYKVGELRIKALRARAEAALGARFDVRAFHDTVLGAGAVPLDVLERRVDAWIAAVSAAAAASPTK